MNKLYFWLFVMLCGVMLATFLFSWPDGRLRYIQCDVGQGDAILITHGFVQILIDSGRDLSAVGCLDRYLPFWDKKIEILVATHADVDHIGGFDEIIKRYSVEHFFYNGFADTSEEWYLLEELLGRYGVSKTVFGEGSRAKVGEITLYGLWPEISEDELLLDNTINAYSETSKQSKSFSASENRQNSNENSLVLRLSYGEFSVLLTGDIPAAVETILAENNDLKSTVLKVSHHGSRTSSSEVFLEDIRPLLATIGVGTNSYGHPSVEVLDALSARSITFFRTDIDGDVVIVTDGQRWRVQQ